MKKVRQNSRTYQRDDLRRGVDYIGVTCVFFCHDGQGRFLLQKRSKNCRDEIDHWDCGGGSMEHGESFQDTIRREVKEEYGVIPSDIKYVATRNIVRQNGSADTHWIANLFVCQVDPKKVKNSDPYKIDEIGWFTYHALPSPPHTVLHEALNLIKESNVLDGKFFLKDGLTQPVAFNKLVRDKIPQIIKRRGGTPKIHVASTSEYWAKLKAKLFEEVEEFNSDETPEELADLLEIIDAICKFKKIRTATLAGIQQNKRKLRGGFIKRLILEETT